MVAGGSPFLHGACNIDPSVCDDKSRVERGRGGYAVFFPGVESDTTQRPVWPSHVNKSTIADQYLDMVDSSEHEYEQGRVWIRNQRVWIAGIGRRRVAVGSEGATHGVLRMDSFAFYGCRCLARTIFMIS